MSRVINALTRGLNLLIDTILPLRPRAARTKNRSLIELPLLVQEHELLHQRVTTLMDYRDSAVEDLIRNLKYDGSGYAAHLCASVLADYLREEIAEQRAFSARKVLIVPVPLHRSRARERGYNQIGLVVEHLPEEFRDGTLSRLSPEAIYRTRETRPQTRLARPERLSNVAGAFSISDESFVSDSHVFLIDDVTTTGATLVNAASPLRQAGANVTLLALARA